MTWVKDVMQCSVGIDIGSAYSKGVIMLDNEIGGSYVVPSGGNYELSADRVNKALLARADQSSNRMVYTIATGYGAQSVTFADEVVTDISCHSKGIFYLSPSVRTAVDIGDLFSKAFRIDERGNSLRFLLSGRCAGGSARVLEVIAKVLQIRLEDMGELSLISQKRVDFNTGCAVFAETEAVSRVAEGVAKEDLLAGIHRALAAQLHSLAERVGIERDFSLVGGGARDIGLVKAVEEITGFDIVVPPEPHLTAALGAAVIAGEKVKGA
ncbi:MAG: 2-hydroxyglutaryl-CoA dehydratase [Deltaproteobacteria bacterium]|nr:2-hydroxyglutaryl-CoA dehydratase [Deltaproteobacteria bacterium]